MTVSAIGICTAAILLFGGFVLSIVYGFQTLIVQSSGHLQIYQKGYFDYGAGNPLAYGIADHHRLRERITSDPVLADLVSVVTPVQRFRGLAANSRAGTSTVFLGVGFIPSEQQAMRSWNGFGLENMSSREVELSDGDADAVIIGTGLARVLSLCVKPEVGQCDGLSPNKPLRSQSDNEILRIMELDGTGQPLKFEVVPQLDILVATAGGAPNVALFNVARTENQGIKEIDDSYIAMSLQSAQRLVYGRGEAKVTALQIQLHRSEDLGIARARLAELISGQNASLELMDFRSATPLYGQVIGMFAMIFGFIALIMGIVVLFTIVNTVAMGVMERISEIGTLRAMGMRRAGILTLFVSEGFVLSVIGLAFGTAFAIVTSVLISGAGVRWTPPSNVESYPLDILIFENPALLLSTAFMIVLLGAVSAVQPARKAARMEIVDALRHV